MMEIQERQTWMDALRGLAILLVVVLHAGIALSFYASHYPRPIEVFNQAFEPYRMATLMFLSGMLLSASLQKRARSYFDGKVRKVAWPYVIWSIIALSIQGDLDRESAVRIFYNPVETHLWYLEFLVIFYAAGWLLRQIPAWVLGLASLVASQFLPEEYRLEKMAFLFAFFMLGHWFTANRSRFRFTESRLALAISGAAAIAASGCNIAGKEVIYEPAYVLGVLGGIVLALRFVPRIPDGWVRSALEYCGRKSMYLFILHLLIIKVLGTLAERAGLTSPWMLFPLLIVAGLFGSVIAAWLAERSKLIKAFFEFPSTPFRGKGLPSRPSSMGT